MEREIDLNSMNYDEIIEYCKSREKWLLDLWIKCEGYESVLKILSDNGKV